MAANLPNILAGAKKVLANTMKVPGEEQFAPKPKPKVSPVKETPPIGVDYNPVHTAKAVADTIKHPDDIAGGLKGVASQAGIPKYHTGGKVKKDGLALLKKDETVRTKEQEKDIQKKIKKTRPKALLTTEESLNPVDMRHNSMPVAYFIRHGSTDMNDDDKFRGDLDVPLNADGDKQAQQLVSYFHNVSPSAIYNSSRSRTAQTINAISDSKNMKSKTIADLDSLDTGHFAGQPKDKANLSKMNWYREHPDSKIPGGDVIREWQSRVDKALVKVFKDGEKDGKPAIACVHGSVIKELSRYLYGDTKKLEVQPGGVVVVYKLPSGGYVGKPILKENIVDEELHPDS